MSVQTETDKIYPVQKIVYESKRNSKDIIVGVIKSSFVSIDERQAVISDLFIDLVQLIESRHNISVLLRYIPYLGGGLKRKNGTWSGAMEYFKENAIDMVTQPYIIDQDRFELIEFPFILVFKYLTILYKPTLEFNDSLAQFLSIFSFDIWTMIIFSFIILNGLSLLKGLSWNARTKILLEYFGLLLSRCIILKHHHDRTLLMTWIIALFFLNLFFCNDIMAKLLSRKPNPIIGLDELFEKKYTILMFNGTYNHHFVSKNYPHLIPRIKTVPQDYLYDSSNKIIRELFRGRTVLLSHGFSCDLVKGIQHQFKLAKSTVLDNNHFLGIPINRRSDPLFKKTINNILKTLYETGEFHQKWFRVSFRNDNEHRMRNLQNFKEAEKHMRKDNEEFRIGLDRILFSFKMLLIGDSISCFVLIASIFKNYLLLYLANKRNND